MDYSKHTSRVLYEEMRLLTKDTIEAASRLKKLCVNPDTHYIVINDHIGDVIISLGYLKAFRAKENLNHVTLVVTDKFSDIVGHYSDDFDKVIYLDAYVMYRIFLLNLTRYGQYILGRNYPNVTFVNPADELLRGFDYVRRYPDISLTSMIRNGCFGLNNGSQFIPLPKPETNPNQQSSSKKVVFSKDARTVIGDADELYNLLAGHFRELGYSIYTNTEDPLQIVEGSERIFLKLEELSTFVTGGIFIGARSGLHDLLLYCDCTLIAFYFKDNDDTKIFSLNSLPCARAKFLEIELSEDVHKDFSEIKEYIS